MEGIEKRYKLGEVCELFGICKKTWYNWIEQKKIPNLARRDKMSRFWYFLDEDIEKLRRLTGR